MPLKLLLFDLDGTLVDTCADIKNALNYAIRPFVAREFSEEETRGLIGEGLHRLIEKATGKINEDREKAVQRFLEYYGRHIADQSVLYPGVKETLGELGRYRKAVISNKRQYLSQKLLEILGVLPHFDLIMGSDSTPEKKPSPVPVRHALEMLYAAPREAIIIGDSRYDIEAGRSAGIATVGAAYGYQERYNLLDADFVIDRFSDLPVVLDRVSSKLL